VVEAAVRWSRSFAAALTVASRAAEWPPAEVSTSPAVLTELVAWT
jgi:hypothetical protein